MPLSSTPTESWSISTRRLAETHPVRPRLFSDERGQPEGLPVLLLPALGRQLLDWDESFCESLGAAGLRVIRIDHRDSGLSPPVDAGKVDIAELLQAVRSGGPYEAPYLLGDMADDITRLMDALQIESAHIVGTSMGGMIGQTIAAHYPNRVRTLTSIMSTTGSRTVGRSASREAAALLWRAPPLDRARAIAFLVAAREVLAGGGPFDAEQAQQEESAAFDRAFAPAGSGRQLAAVVASGDRTDELAAVAAPTLVIHGTNDPLIDPSGGEATANAIPRARFLAIEGMGHHFTLPEPFRGPVIAAVLAHVAR